MLERFGGYCVLLVVDDLLWVGLCGGFLFGYFVLGIFGVVGMGIVGF